MVDRPLRLPPPARRRAWLDLRLTARRRGLLFGLVVLLVWATIGWAIANSIGSYIPESMREILVATVALLALVALPMAPAAPSATLAAAGLVFGAVAGHKAPQWSYAGGADVAAAHRLLEVTALAVIPLALASGTRRLAMPVAVVAGMAAGFIVTAASTRPGIDVWVILQQSAAGLVHGQNMYKATWIGSPGQSHGYPYMPWTTVVLVPFRELVGDVRYGLVCAMAAAAVIVHRIARGGAAAPMLATMVFLVPGGLTLTESAWTEPLLLAYLAGCLLAAVSGRRTLAVGLLALAVATKQYVWILLPVFAFWRPFGLRRTVIATVAGAAISLPWIVAGPAAFWNNVVVDLYRLPAARFSLSLSRGFARHHLPMPVAVVVAATLVALVLALRYTRQTGNVAIAAAAVLLVFDVFNRHSFFNHYWLVSGLLVVGWALSARLATPVDDALTQASTPADGHGGPVHAP